MVTIPFSPFPMEKLLRLSQGFIPIGLKLRKMFPSLEMQLKQADIDINFKEYLGIIVFLSSLYMLIFGFLFTLILSKFVSGELNVLGIPIPIFLVLGITVGLVVSFLTFLQISMYPLMHIRKKEKEIEKNLLFGLRTILIEIKSGVTLFEAMKTIARSNYGQLSIEFKKAVDEINTGVTYDDALQKLATNNPSPYFRKAIWQIVNGMKAGGDIASIIRETVSSATRDQRIAINRYSGKLRVLSLGYMMIGVIIPGLGLTILIIIGTLLSSFTSIQIGEPVFIMMLIGVSFIQLLYVGMIKSQRPTMT